MKGYKTKKQRVLAVFLCFCILFTLPGISDAFPVAAAGQEESAKVDNIIIDFTPLSEEVKEQIVSVGTDLDKLNLPDELTVCIEYKQETAIAISGVTWESEPAYDKNIEGVYLFTPVLPEDYLLAEGVSLPEIRVTVTEKEKSIHESEIEIELLEPDWDDPFVKEYNISAVLSVPGEWDSYDWQVFAGPYAEEEETPWVSGSEFGMEELVSDGKLSLDKEMLMTYAFRCVVEQDGELFATIPYAEDEEALTAPLYHIMTLADFQSGAGVWAQSESLAVAAPGSSSKSFDVYGVKKKGGFYKTTYGNFGYYIASRVGSKEVEVKWGASPKTDIFMGSSLVGQFDYEIVYNGRYAKITYTVKNTGSAVQSFQVGSSADVMIDENDKAPVSGTSMGLQMKDGKGKTFHLVVPDADTTWFGYFGQAYDNIFTNLEDKSTPYKGDSGMAWSWRGSVAPGGIWKRSALIGIGELPVQPAAPTVTIAVDGNRSYVIPKEKITVSGTATAGTTVHIMAGGTEYEAAVGNDRRFSTEITIPADAKDRIDIICWAVSSEGGISNTVTKSLTVSNEPRISLTDSTATVVEGDTLNEAWYQNFIDTTVGTISHTTVSTDKPGTYDVTYTAKVTGFADAKAVLKVTVFAHPLEIAVPTATRSGTTNKFDLTAKLAYPGADEITETGFVWGIMQNPTTSICNGSQTTTPAVKTKGSSISVATDEIADGVTYYCRAYVVAKGVTYYSEQTSFAIGAKSYGTFTVSGKDNKFTITRADGMDGTQTVYYRTKNGSAVAGTHYTQNAGTATFAQGETSIAITVEEQGANAVYDSKAATAYANAGREYFFEIYRVDGGGKLGTATEAKRTMETNKKIDRSIYNSEKSTTGIVTSSDPKYIQDRNKDQEAGDATVNFTDVNRGDVSNWHRDIGVEEIYGSEVKAYLAETPSTDWLYRFALSGKEKTQGYEDVWFGSQKPPVGNHALGGAKTLPDLTGQIWAGIFEIEGSGKMAETTMAVLGNSGSLSPTTGAWKVSGITYDNNQYGCLNINQSAWVCFSAHGEEADQWYITAYDEYSVVRDGSEPKLLGVGGTESNSKYKAGDTFYISLIFDEIVDGTNSTLNNVSVKTSWGDASYAGGADTNVLYFKGKVSNTASGALTLTRINNPDLIKDMCAADGTATATGTGNAGGNVVNTTPTVTVENIANANGTLTAVVSATNHSTLKYTWTQRNAMPATGWLDIASGGTATTRQTSGTWYLHALATNADNGKTAYTSESITIPSSGTGAVSLPELTVSTDNTNWAKSRTINITKSPSNAAVTYTGPGVTSPATVSGDTVPVTQNGIYTFKLTSGSDTVVEQVTVSRIDRNEPTAALTEPGNMYLTQSENVTFVIKPGDTGGSGVKTVTGKWYQNGSSSGTNVALTANNDGTYTAKTTQTAGTSGTWTLTVTVTDNANNSTTVSSQTYTVNLKAPTVKVTQGATDKNGAVNYTYSVNGNGQTIQSIELPDGTITKNTSGSFKLTNAGTYYVTVTDTAGHVVQSDALTLSGSVDGEPPEVRLVPDITDWVNDDTGVTVTVSVYDNVAPIAASLEKEDGASENLSLAQDNAAGVGNQAKTGCFIVKENGTYTVTARDAKGNTATESINIANIDSTAPTATAVVDSSDWSTSHTVTVTAEDAGEQSGVKSVKYAVVSTPNGTATDLATLAAADNGTVEVNTDGIHYLYCVVEDNAGNTNTCHSDAIKIDTAEPDITVTGGTTGASSLKLGVSASFGGSGKKALTVKKGAGGAETELTGNTYDVSGTGTYYFTATSNAGKSKSKSVTVYSISFIANGGSAAATQYVVGGGKAAEPAAPARDGYIFAGWYSNSALTTKYTFTASVTKNTTLYAKWTAGTNTVTYHKNGGTIADEDNYSSYTTGTGLTLPTPVRTGYAFAGWYAREELTGDTVTSISDTDTGNKEYWAKWAEGTPNASIDYKKETLKGLTPGRPYEISTEDGGTQTIEADESGEIPIDPAWFGKEIAVVRPGDGDKTADSEPQRLTVPEKNTPAPDGTFDVVYVSEPDASDGKITGTKTEDKLEYSTDGGKTWKPVTGAEITGLPAGGCELRISGDNDSNPPKFPSESVTVTVGVKTKEDKPDGVGIDYEEKRLMGFEPGKDYKVSTDNGSTWTDMTADDEGRIPLPEGSYGKEIAVKKPGNGTTTSDSVPAIVKAPARGDAPSGLDAEFASSEGASDGKITGVTSNMEYSSDGGKTWTQIAEDDITDNAIAGLPKGSYQVRYAADNSADNGKGRFESEPVTVEIGIKGREETPDASVDYEKETLTGLKPGKDYKIGTDGGQTGTVTADENGEIPIAPAWFGKEITVVKAGDGKNTTDSIEKKITVPASLEKPVPSAVGETAPGKKDGKLTGLTAGTTYEVSTDGGSTWETMNADGSGEITELAPGTYTVRVKAGNSNFASEPSEPVTIYTTAYTVTLQGGGGSGTALTSYKYGTGAVLPTDWTKTGYTFDGWYDNEGCTGTAVTAITSADTGNKEYWAKWTDNIAPVIGSLQYSYQPKYFWHWLLGRDSLIITAPVTEEGSGADEITYTVTPEGGTASAKASTIVNGEAKITVSVDFKGTIAITCTDKAGNTSPSVTVGKDLDGSVNGIIIEDNPPQIAFEANGSVMSGADEYGTAPAIYVTVTDDKDNAISAGIASVSYSVGNGSTKTVDHDYAAGMVINDSFTIPASEIPAGETVITVTVTDNVGNTFTATQTVKVHSHSGKLVPAITPTCTAAGNKQYYHCTCGKNFEDSGCTKEIADVSEEALGHDFANSDYQYDETGHWQQCSRCTETTEQEQHSFENNSLKCSKCDFEKAGEGHIHSGKETVAAKAATCTEDGNTAYYICTCGKWFSDNACTKEITDHKSVAVPAKGHLFPEQWTVEKEATEKEPGRQYKICQACGIKKYQTIDPTGTPEPDDSELDGNDIEKRKDLSILLATGKQKGSSGIKLTWLKWKDASGYEVYWSYCDGKKNYKKLKTLKAAKRTYTHKKLKRNRAYKYYIAAYKMVDGKKKYVAKSPVIHVAMKYDKRTNAKKITVNKTKAVLSLTGGTYKKTFQIKAKVKKENSKKNLLTHAAELRYYSDDKKVAKVSKKGKITAVGKGKCTVYVIANNGVYKKITVIVK